MVMVTVMFMVRPWDGASDVRRSHRNTLGCLEEIVALRDLSLGRGRCSEGICGHAHFAASRIGRVHLLVSTNHTDLLARGHHLGGFALDPGSRANRSIDDAPLEISFSIRRIFL